MRKNAILIFVGPDKSGKTTIAKEIVKIYDFFYFKNNHDKYFKGENNLPTLYSEANLILCFLKQIDIPIIIDRGYPCEAAYATVFNRKTDVDFLLKVDNEFCKFERFYIIFCFKDSYYEQDELYDDINKQIALKNAYFNFLMHCKTNILYLNTTDMILSNQINKIKEFVSL